MPPPGGGVVDHHAIPRTDPFSWTMGGQTWQSNGWLWGLLLWALWSIGGVAAIAALKPVFVVASGMSIRWSSRTLGAPAGPAMVGALVGTAATFPFLVERPQLASFLLAPIALALAHRALGGHRPWAWTAGVVGLFAVWANLHSVALSGVPLVGALAFGAAFDQRQSRTAAPWLRATTITAAAAAGTLVNPWGVGLWTHAAEVRSASRGYISEWEPLWRTGTGGWIALLIVVGVVALAVRLGALRRMALFLPLVGTGVLAIDAIRSFPVFAVVAATTVPVLMTAGRPLNADRRRMLAVGTVAALVLAVVVAVPRVASTGRPSDETPVASTEALPAGCRVLNDYRFGNWVMFARPDVPVSDDGRNDLYGIDDPRGPFLTDPAQAQALPQWAAQNGVNCVLASPESPAKPALVAAGWREVANDGNAVALVKG